MRVRAGTFVVSAACAIAAAHPQAQPPVAERAAALILDAPGPANNVWQGFSLVSRDWLIYSPDGVYLHTRRAPPADFERRGRLFFRAGTLPGLKGTIDWAYPIGDAKATAVPVKQTPELTAELLYHEAFHAFQGETFKFPPDDPASTASLVLTPALAADIEVERQLLRDAVLGDPSDDRWFRRVAAFRLSRRATTPELLGAQERILERREGLADYVAQRSIARARGRPQRAALEENAQMLVVPLRTFGGSADERLIRWRSYGTGAAFAVLLDRAGIDWKRRARTEPLDDLLLERVALPASEVEPLAADVRRQYGYDALVSNQTPPWGALTGMTEAEFAALAPYKLILELGEGATIGWNLRVSGVAATGMHRPSPEVLLLPALTRLTVRDRSLEATSGARPVRLLSKADRTYEITILLPSAPRLNGQPLAAPMDTSLTGVRLEGDDVLVTASGTVRLVADATSVRVTQAGGVGRKP